MKKNKKVDRREFIKTVAAISASTPFIACVSAPIRKLSQAKVETIYDYIIVGTGAGGAPLAARLALKGHSVLCIEAGFEHTDESGNSPVEMGTPAYHALSTESPEWSWNFFVRHNGSQRKNILGQGEPDLLDSKYEQSKGGILYPRASGIGGSTIHNAMITVYPDNKDWLDLQRLSGDASWSPQNMRKYFRLIEDKLYGTQLSLGAHGFKGWLSTSQSSLKFLLRDLIGNPYKGELIKNPFARLVLANAKAWAEIRGESTGGWGTLKRDIQVLKDIAGGLNKGLINLDTNSIVSGPKPEGLYRVTTAIDKNGKRSGPKQWLLEVAARDDVKLDIVTGHLAAKVLFEVRRGDHKHRALGVECLISEKSNLYKASPRAEKLTIQTKKQVYKAKKEVILAGGAFNTPQLLMLSGLGQEDELEKLGIHPIINLPAVGNNLQDRYEVGVVSKLNENIEDLEKCSFDPEKDPCLQDYFADPTSSLYGTNGVIIGNMVRSRFSKNKLDEDPDLFVFAVPGDFRGYSTGWSKTATQKNKITWAVLKAKTSNTSGTVKLKSSDPTDTPNINFNSFTDGKEDLLAVLDGVNFARRVNKQTPLTGLIKEEQVPGDALTEADQINSFIAKEAWGHHASCTCPMGKDIRKSVVDFDFKVHNTTNLRIVDASVFPNIPGHFIVTPIYMIAEKAADIIDRQS